jgi:hypothetical protein
MRAGRLSGLSRADYALPPHTFAPLRSRGGDRDAGAIGVNAESAI